MELLVPPAVEPKGALTFFGSFAEPFPSYLRDLNGRPPWAELVLKIPEKVLPLGRLLSFKLPENAWDPGLLNDLVDPLWDESDFPVWAADRHRRRGA